MAGKPASQRQTKVPQKGTPRSGGQNKRSTKIPK